MEGRISRAEQEVARLEAELADPGAATDHERLEVAYKAHQAAKDEVNRLFARWEELERKATE